MARIAPFGTYGEEPKDKVLLMPMMHRKRVAVGEGAQARSDVPALHVDQHADVPKRHGPDGP